jgi:hypothetical protein
MKSVKNAILIMMLASVSLLGACKKDECHECHYEDDSNQKVELGMKCEEELESLEADGYTTGGKIYTVHCHEH